MTAPPSAPPRHPRPAGRWLAELAGQRALLSNTGSLIGATGITTLVGVLFWWLAARLLPVAAVGYGSAAVSAMMLVGTFGMAGLNTVLIGELARRPGRSGGLLSAALSASALVSAAIAAAFLLVGTVLAPGVAPYLAGPGDAALFVAGAGLTGAGLVLDEAVLGLVMGSVQVWRNAAMAVAKLALLAGLVLVAHHYAGTGILEAWTLGTLVSLVPATALLQRRGVRILAVPEWRALRRLGRAAARNTWLNDALETPRLVVPLLATGLISAAAGGAFYVAWMVASLAYLLSHHLTLALYAVGAGEPEGLVTKLRFTLRVSLLGGLAGVPLLVLLAHPLLALFGSAYAEAATLPLRVLAPGYFGAVLMYHYVALCRVRERTRRAAVFATAACTARLAGAVIGALAGGLLGMSLALLVVMCAEGAAVLPAVWAASRGRGLGAAAEPAPAPGPERAVGGSDVPGAEAGGARQRTRPTTRSRPRAGRDVHAAGLAFPLMALGVLIVSLAYAAGRGGAQGPWWSAAYWLGEVVLFGPVIARLLVRGGPSEREGPALVLALATGTYLVKYLYSPRAFRFPDELQHWRSATNVLESHHLFGFNELLPVSPSYPGLEEATTALATTTGLSVFVAGLLVAGLAHLLLGASLYAVFRQVGGSARLATLACTIYALNPHFLFFDSIFAYQTLALAFLGLGLLAALELARSSADRSRWWVLAVGLLAATVVTHHVTSYVLAGTLILLAVLGAAQRRRQRRRAVPVTSAGTPRIAVLAGVAVALVAAWLGLVAPFTVQYLAPAGSHVLDGLAALFTGHLGGGGAAAAGPPWDRAANYAAAVLVAVGLPFGWRHIWRTQRQHVWALALGAGSVAYYVVTVVRVAVPDGAELAGRSLTFLYIPVGYTLAMALAWLLGVSWRGAWRAARARAPAVLAGSTVVVLLLGGIAAAWPAYWERLPGPYVVDGFESGITPESVAAADWARTRLGPEHRIAADTSNYLLLGSYGDQNVIRNVNRLFFDPLFTAADARLTRRAGVDYVLVDLRTSRFRPPPGVGYFPGPPAEHHPEPIPRQNLRKFGSLTAASRIYDSGDIIVYRLPGARDAG